VIRNICLLTTVNALLLLYLDVRFWGPLILYGCLYGTFCWMAAPDKP
jgi:hypothetical protein